MPKKSFLKELDKELQPKIPKSSTSSGSEVPIKFRFDTQRQKLLKSRGVDGYAFSMARSPFVVEDAFVRIKPKVTWLPEDFVLRSISIGKQINNLHRLMSNPLRGSYTAAIGSYPSDTRAKLIAVNIMNAAIDAQIAGKLRGRAYPLWHRLYGGLYDNLRDSKETQLLSLLVITNVGVDSSQNKLEKLRDLMERYDNTPKIVVVNGIDPVTFFAERVRLPLNYAFYCSAEQKASILDI
jgi:hypothetical protein